MREQNEKHFSISTFNPLIYKCCSQFNTFSLSRILCSRIAGEKQKVEVIQKRLLCCMHEIKTNASRSSSANADSDWLLPLISV